MEAGPTPEMTSTVMVTMGERGRKKVQIMEWDQMGGPSPYMALDPDLTPRATCMTMANREVPSHYMAQMVSH